MALQTVEQLGGRDAHALRRGSNGQGGELGLWKCRCCHRLRGHSCGLYEFVGKVRDFFWKCQTIRVKSLRRTWNEVGKYLLLFPLVPVCFGKEFTYLTT